MRVLIMFDLPVETSHNRKEYRRFVKFIKGRGFLMMQKSIYIKLLVNDQAFEQERRYILSSIPQDGVISLLSITEKQFQAIENILGESSSRIVSTTNRYLEL